jgi:hypothetical protein
MKAGIEWRFLWPACELKICVSIRGNGKTFVFPNAQIRYGQSGLILMDTGGDAAGN